MVKEFKILDTQNKKWGFWGTCSTHVKKEKVKAAWDTAFKVIQEKAGFTPLETLALMDSRWGRHTVDEFFEEITADCFETAFKRKMTKERLYRDYNYYVDDTAYKPKKSFRYENFARDLAKLSKTYGITVKSIGGVEVHAIGKMKGFKGYTADLDSGDLMPVWNED